MRSNNQTLASLLLAASATVVLSGTLWAQGVAEQPSEAFAIEYVQPQIGAYPQPNQGFLIEYVQPEEGAVGDEHFDPAEGATRTDDEEFDDEEDYDEDDCYDPWGGWVQGGYTFNPYGPQDGSNGTVGLNDFANDFQMNQAWFFLQRVPVYEPCVWDYGYRADVVYGTDSRFFQIPDFDGAWGQSGDYQLSVLRAYVDVAYDKWNLRLGRFDSLVGYESFEAPQNFFYSHSYSFNFGTPTSYLGGMVSYQATEQLEINFVAGRGPIQLVDPALDDGQLRPVYSAGFSWKSCDEQSWIDVYGEANEGSILGGAGDKESLIYTAAAGTKLSCNTDGMVQFLRGYQDASTWYGVQTQVYHYLNDCWSAGIRAEWFRDDDGGVVSDFNDPTSGPFVGNFYELTFALNYEPCCGNLSIRPELRYDWYDEDNSGGPLPFDDGTKAEQFLLSLDFIYSY